MNIIQKPISINDQKMFNMLDKAGNLGNHWTRLALGVGALSIEPAVDYYSNKKLDDETRKYSVGKTILKIVVGTTTGFLARYLAGAAGKRYFTEMIEKQKQAIINFSEKQLKGLNIFKQHEDISALSKKALKNLKNNSKNPTEIINKLKKDINDTFKINIDGLPISDEYKDLLPERKINFYINQAHDKASAKFMEKIKFEENKEHLGFTKETFEKLVKNPKSVAEQLSSNVGDVVGIGVTAMFTLLFDVPLINYTLTKVMGKFFPNHTGESKKPERQVK